MINKSTDNTPASLRKAHRGLFLSDIQMSPGISRAELARRQGFSEMAATRIVRELVAAGIVEEFSVDTPKKSVGRPKTGLRIVKDGIFAGGITVSAYHSEVSICDANGSPVARAHLDDPPLADVAKTAKFYARALHDLIIASGIDQDRMVGVGVSLSARTQPEEGRIVKSEYFGWGGDDGRFCREIRALTNLPVEVENISNSLAIAEMRFGAARDISDFTLIHAATFVGASVVSDHRLVRGASEVSGLIGHFRAQTRPLECVCGRNDCLNLSATGFGLLSQLGKLDHQRFDRSRLSYYATSLLAALEDGKADALVQQAGAQLAPALDCIVKLLGPQRVILSGHLGTNETYYSAVETALRNDFDYGTDSDFELTKGTFSSGDAAALLALHVFCYSNRLDYQRFA